MIDFAVIGAQKAGTCSLRQWLCMHPEIECAPWEAACWAAPPFRHGKADDLNSVFTGESGKITGIVAPQYGMGYIGKSADNLRFVNPQLKVILLTRDRVERAFSAWLMNYNRHWETLSFDDRIASCLKRDGRHGPRFDGVGGELNSYVTAGCYEQIYRIYAFAFGRENVMTAEIEDPELPDKITDFLGVARSTNAVPHLHTGEYGGERISPIARAALEQYYIRVGEI